MVVDYVRRVVTPAERKHKLSADMWMTLSYMRSSSAVYHSSNTDRTMNALKRRGLVYFSHARRYGRGSWHLTELGASADLNKE